MDRYLQFARVVAEKQPSNENVETSTNADAELEASANCPKCVQGHGALHEALSLDLDSALADLLEALQVWHLHSMTSANDADERTQQVQGSTQAITLVLQRLHAHVQRPTVRSLAAPNWLVWGDHDLSLALTAGEQHAAELRAHSVRGQQACLRPTRSINF